MLNLAFFIMVILYFCNVVSPLATIIVGICATVMTEIVEYMRRSKK